MFLYAYYEKNIIKIKNQYFLNEKQNIQKYIINGVSIAEQNIHIYITSDVSIVEKNEGPLQ